jgi:cellulose synthase/poly-beta-1,6-N-acetylglucosamine synthase-like glycosyltransferase
MLIGILTVFGLYAAALLLLRAGVRRVLSQPRPPVTHQVHFLSIVVPYRNELAHLGALIEDIKSQHYPAFSFEVILIDDHSTDGSAELVGRLTRGDTRFRLAYVSKNEKGKKQALLQGIQLSKGEIILTTDADCRLPENWCRTLNAWFELPGVQICQGPVRLAAPDNFLGHIWCMEYAGVAAVTLGSAGWHRPLMASGANMAFRKSAFYDVGGFFNERTLASGDDQLLMEKMTQRFYRPVVYAADAQALVTTAAPGTWRQFFSQRLRWAGKWMQLAWPARLTAVFVFGFHTAVVSSWVIAALVPALAPFVAAAAVVKAVAEWMLLRPVTLFLQHRWSTMAFLFWQVAYPLYALAVALLSLRGRYVWKERNWTGQG